MDKRKLKWKQKHKCCWWFFYFHLWCAVGSLAGLSFTLCKQILCPWCSPKYRWSTKRQFWFIDCKYFFFFSCIDISIVNMNSIAEYFFFSSQYHLLMCFVLLFFLQIFIGISACRLCIDSSHSNNKVPSS